MTTKFFGKKTALIVSAAVVALICAVAGLWYFFAGSYRLSGNDNLIAAIGSIEAPSDSSVSGDKIYPSPLRVIFTAPLARIDRLYQPLESGVAITPSIRGQWVWENDSRLRFTPESDWIPNTEYKVVLSDEILNPQVELKDNEFSFSAPSFSGKVVDSDFYEDPQNIKNKSATASFRFNYPLNPQNIKDKISVKTASGENYDFTYKLTDQNTVLHVVSAPLKIKSEEDFAKITVAGAENAYNKKTFDGKLTATVKIPSSSTFFKVKSVSSAIVRNEQNNDNPEQILFVNFSTAVNSAGLAENLKLYFSKDNCRLVRKKIAENRKNGNGFYDNMRQLALSEVSVNEDNLKNHMFKYDADYQKGCLTTVISKGLRSVEGFRLGEDVVETTDIVPYPQEARIAFDGAVLPLNGSREVAFLSRGVKELRISVARIDSASLNHLVTQTSGDFAHPYFRNYNFTEDNISEIFEKKLNINAEHPAEANYSSLNLNEYFKDKKGVFLVKVRGYADDNHYSSEDSRLIMITDLGIVVKDNLNQTHDIFISDISESRPVSGAVIDVLGKNGLPVISVKTNAEGKASIPDFSGFKKDREAVVYKVTNGNDVSFLPISRSDRRMDMSRFDVGGEYDYGQDENALKGYIFSDRGIYRPGETAHFGIIVRQNDLNVPKKLPFAVEVRNPAGDIVAVRNIWADAAGFMEYSLELRRTAKTGLYTLLLYVNDKNSRRFVSAADFKVEEFQPDNLRLKVDWENYAGTGWYAAKNLKASVALYNLYGNPAAAHEIKADYSLTPADFHFKQYAGYLFRDPLRNADKAPRSYRGSLSPLKTDVEGKGKLAVDLSQFEQGTYRLSLSVEGFELGSGRGVSASLGALISPNEYLVGWKADGDLSYIARNSAREIQFIAVDNTLRQIAKDDLFISLSRRRYVSSLVEMPNGTYRYQMVPKEQVIFKQPWQIASTGGKETLKTDEAGEFILTVTDNDGRLLAKVAYDVAGAANLSHAVDKDASLGLKLNHEEYSHGDDIEMQITAPYAGYGLITIERDSVYAYKWFRAETTSVVEKIELPDSVEGNAYVNVAFFRDVNSPEIYMPSLSYAAAPFSINKSDRRIDVDLNVPENVKPGDDLTVTYKTSDKAKIIVYGVNQGILQVAGYTQPNPLNEFLKKKALRVVTSQIMDLIMPDIRILRMLSSSGGDDSYEEAALEKNLNPFARKTDKPVAFWSGILDSDEKGGTYVYKVPENFNGEIKVMAVAVSESRFGSASRSVLSRGDFALIPSGPLNVSPGDEFVVGLSVGNLVENSGDDYEVRVSLNPGNGFEVVGNKVQTVKMSEKGEAMLKFRLKALPKLGAKELVFMAESVKDNTKTARMPYTLSLRPSTPYDSRFAMGFERSEYKLSGIETLYDEYRVQQVSASVSPLVLASGLLKYLNKYPHVCTEQTISKVFPAMEVFFKYPELVKNMDIYALFDDAMLKLRERQTINGGFTTWNVSGVAADPFDSVYAAHFLVKAREHNFNVPENMLQKALAYCEEQAGRTPDGINDIVPAYAAYVLTLSGRVTTSYLLNLEEYYKDNYAKNWKESLNASFMAAGYALLQDNAKARSLAGQYKYGASGDIADDAANIYLMASYFPNDFGALREDNVKTLLKPLNSGAFNTISSAYAVLALNAFSNEEDDKNIHFSGSQPQYTPFPTVDFNASSQGLTVTSEKPFYYVVAQQGFPRQDKTAPFAEGMEVSKKVYDKAGNEVSKAGFGDELIVKITYRGLRRDAVSDVALVDLLPGCFEVVDNSLETDWNTDSSEIRDDRVISYVTAGREAHEISYRVKVIAEGNFVLPPVYASAMYLPLVRANSASGTIKSGE